MESNQEQFDYARRIIHSRDITAIASSDLLNAYNQELRTITQVSHSLAAKYVAFCALENNDQDEKDGFLKNILSRLKSDLHLDFGRSVTTHEFEDYNAEDDIVETAVNAVEDLGLLSQVCEDVEVGDLIRTAYLKSKVRKVRSTALRQVDYRSRARLIVRRHPKLATLTAIVAVGVLGKATYNLLN